MKHGTKAQAADEDDKAKLAYRLTADLPAIEAVRDVAIMFGLSHTQAKLLILNGKRLAAQTIGRKA